MIELTKEEVLCILKVLSSVEGYLLSVPGSMVVSEIMDYPVEILSKKLIDKKEV